MVIVDEGAFADVLGVPRVDNRDHSQHHATAGAGGVELFFERDQFDAARAEIVEDAKEVYDGTGDAGDVGAEDGSGLVASGNIITQAFPFGAMTLAASAAAADRFFIDDDLPAARFGDGAAQIDLAGSTNVLVGAGGQARVDAGDGFQGSIHRRR